MFSVAWRVLTWPAVELTVERWQDLSRSFQHVASSPSVSRTGQAIRSGQILWAGEDHGRPVGLAWEWGAVASNSCAMTDPMTIMTNAVFVSQDGTYLSESQQVLLLNNLIWQLPWQEALASAGVEPFETEPACLPVFREPAEMDWSNRKAA